MAGETPPPQGLYLGSDSFSKSNTECPFLAKWYAAVAPAGPAPTMIVSYIIAEFLPSN